VWLWSGENPWNFASLPDALTDEFVARAEDCVNRSGMVPVEARSSDVTWWTSVFPDEVSQTSLLLLRKSIRTRLDGRRAVAGTKGVGSSGHAGIGDAGLEAFYGTDCPRTDCSKGGAARR